MTDPSTAEEIEERYEAWASARRLKRSHGRCHPARLAGRRPGIRATVEFRGRRWVDHPRLWIREGQPVCITSEPYGLSEQDRQDIRDLAEKFDLWVEIRPPEESLWYPGGTWFVQLWARSAKR